MPLLRDEGLHLIQHALRQRCEIDLFRGDGEFAPLQPRDVKQIVHQPDEPLVGLDPKSARLVKDVFLKLSARGCTLFMCTHVLEIAERLCSRVGIMIQGRLVSVGTLAEIKAGKVAALEDVFLELTGGSEYAALLKHL